MDKQEKLEFLAVAQRCRVEKAFGYSALATGLQIFDVHSGLVKQVKGKSKAVEL